MLYEVITIPIGEKRYFNYYREDTIKMYADKYGWDLITASNIKQKFMDFVEKMDMSFSYKPVLLKAIFDHIDEDGKVRICDIVSYFISFYEDRKEKGLVAVITSYSIHYTKLYECAAGRCVPRPIRRRKRLV